MNAYDVICRAGDDRELWHAERLKGLTASTAAQLLGCHVYGSLLSTYLRYRNPQTEPDVPTEDQQWGRDRQASIIKNIAARLDMPGWESEELVRSKSDPWMLATLDSWVEPPPEREQLPLEVKASRHPRAAEEWLEGAPAHVRAQVQWQLAVTDKPKALVAATLFGAPPVYEWIERDESQIDELKEKGFQFWSDIRDGNPPPPDGTDAARDAVRDMAGDIEGGKTIELGIDAFELTGEIAELAAKRRALHKMEKALKQQIDLLLGDAQFGILPGENAGQWKRTTSTHRGYVRVDGAPLMEIERSLRESGIEAALVDVPEKISRQLRKVK